MIREPFKPLVPGQPVRPPSASEYNREHEAIARLEAFHVAGFGGSEGAGAAMAYPQDDDRLLIRILSGSNPYAWEEVFRAETNGDAEDYGTGERSGTADSLAAFELNHNTAVPADTVVRAVVNAAKQCLEFEYPAAASSQTFLAGSAGSNFNVSVGGGFVTYNLPDASTTARGAMTTTDQTFTGLKTFNQGVYVPSPSGSVWVGGASSATTSTSRWDYSNGLRLTSFETTDKYTYVLVLEDDAFEDPGFRIASRDDSLVGGAAWIRPYYSLIDTGGTARQGAYGTDSIGNAFAGGICYSVGSGGGYTDEQAQDAVGGGFQDTDTVNSTYNDGAGTFSWAVVVQMSITSDASGIKLDGDSAAPGNSRYYGTNGAGTKWFHALPSGVAGPGSSTDNAVARWDGAGGATLQDSTLTISDAGAVDNTLSDAATNSVSTIATWRHATSGSATTGFGIAHDFYMENSDGTSSNVGQINWAWGADASEVSGTAIFTVKFFRSGGLVDGFKVTTDTIVWYDSAGNALTLSAGPITANRTVSFPDAAGTVVLADATQTLTNKTINGSQLVANSVSDAELRQGNNCSVMGRSANSAGDVADISSSVNGSFLARESNTLVWSSGQLVRGFCKAQTDGNVAGSHNVSSLSDNGTGDVSVNWDTDFSNTAYTAVASAQTDSAIFGNIENSSFAVGTTRVRTYNTSGTLTDPNYFQVLSIGPQ